ncbi:hypothetical protein Q7P37_004285 [Cladosporium fusiforme]
MAFLANGWQLAGLRFVPKAVGDVGKRFLCTGDPAIVLPVVQCLHIVDAACLAAAAEPANPPQSSRCICRNNTADDGGRARTTVHYHTFTLCSYARRKRGQLCALQTCSITSLDLKGSGRRWQRRTPGPAVESLVRRGGIARSARKKWASSCMHAARLILRLAPLQAARVPIIPFDVRVQTEMDGMGMDMTGNTARFQEIEAGANWGEGVDDKTADDDDSLLLLNSVDWTCLTCLDEHTLGGLAVVGEKQRGKPSLALVPQPTIGDSWHISAWRALNMCLWE